MEARGTLIEHLLRVITPEELNELITILNTGRRRSLTAMLEREEGLTAGDGAPGQGEGAARTDGAPEPPARAPGSKGSLRDARASYEEAARARPAAGTGGGAAGGSWSGVLVNKRQS